MSEDEAATVIAGLFRRREARKRLLMMASAVYEKAYDESTGCFFYFNTKTQESHWDKPKVGAWPALLRVVRHSQPPQSLARSGAGLGGRASDAEIQGSRGQRRYQCCTERTFRGWVACVRRW